MLCIMSMNCNQATRSMSVFRNFLRSHTAVPLSVFVAECAAFCISYKTSETRARMKVAPLHTVANIATLGATSALLFGGSFNRWAPARFRPHFVAFAGLFLACEYAMGANYVPPNIWTRESDFPEEESAGQE